MVLVIVLESVGASLLILAYVGLGFWWRDTDPPFIVLNLVGAALLAAIAWASWHTGFAVLNTVWFLVAVRAFLGWLASRRIA